MSLSERELSGILDNEQRSALGFLSGELSKDREKALDYYYGRPFGTEQAGRSQVVIRDVQDTVEWILPSLLKIFTAGDDTVAFEPRGPEDEQYAKQATEYCNYVFQQDNPGFMIFYDLFKDGLLQKNGLVKVYWDKEAIEENRTLEDMDDESYTLLLNDPDIEILAHTENSAAGPGSSPPLAAGGAGPTGVQPPAVDPMQQMAGAAGNPSPGGQMDVQGQAITEPPVVTHDVKYRKKAGKVCIEPVPPEEFLISRRAKTLHSTPYCAHRTRKTISELIQAGYDRAKLMTLASGDSTTLNEEAETRRKTDDEAGPEVNDREGVMREVWLTEHYILVDFDEDDIAERRKVVTAGTTSVVLENEEWEGPLPFASVTPIPVPHRFYGQSIFDLVQDLQLIRSTLMRQMLDNLYLTNNPRHFGDKGRINQDDYNSPEPGGLVGTDGDPNGIVLPFNVPFTGGASLPVMEFLEQVRQNRTGVTSYNQGSDADSLNKTASGISQIMNAADQRTELIARIFAETGVKDIFKIILYCATKYQSKERVIRLRNEWVPMDPRQWESNYDVRVNVGLGTGNKDQMLMHLQSVLGIQAQALQFQGGANGPLVTLENIYNTCTKMIENSGLKHAEQYFTDPKNAEPQPPKPDPEMAKLQQEGQIKQAQMQMDAQNQQQEFALKAKQTEQEMQLQLAKAAADIQLQREKAQADIQMGREKQVTDQQMQQQKMAGDQTIAKDKIGQDAQLARESLNAKTDAEGTGKNVLANVQKLAGDFSSTAKELATKIEQLTQLIGAEREIVRGTDGRATGVRIRNAG